MIPQNYFGYIYFVGAKARLWEQRHVNTLSFEQDPVSRRVLLSLWRNCPNTLRRWKSVREPYRNASWTHSMLWYTSFNKDLTRQTFVSTKSKDWEMLVARASLSWPSFGLCSSNIKFYYLQAKKAFAFPISFAFSPRKCSLPNRCPWGASVEEPCECGFKCPPGAAPPVRCAVRTYCPAGFAHHLQRIVHAWKFFLVCFYGWMKLMNT